MDSEILNTILNYLKSNVRELGLFKAKEYLINQIKIDSTDNYTPYLDSYDTVSYTHLDVYKRQY